MDLRDGDDAAGPLGAEPVGGAGAVTRFSRHRCFMGLNGWLPGPVSWLPLYDFFSRFLMWVLWPRVSLPGLDLERLLVCRGV